MREPRILRSGDGIVGLRIGNFAIGFGLLRADDGTPLLRFPWIWRKLQ